MKTTDPFTMSLVDGDNVQFTAENLGTDTITVENPAAVTVDTVTCENYGDEDAYPCVVQ